MRKSNDFYKAFDILLLQLILLSSVQSCSKPSHSDNDNEWVPFDEPPLDPPCSRETKRCEKKKNQSLHSAIDENPSNSIPSNDAQILEEFPLPRMFIPGKIVHIYTHRGGYKAAFVPRKFRQLRRISLAGNMLSDHMAKAYYEGLLEVKAIRAANEELPQWVGFGKILLGEILLHASYFVFCWKHICY